MARILLVPAAAVAITVAIIAILRPGDVVNDLNVTVQGDHALVTLKTPTRPTQARLLWGPKADIYTRQTDWDEFSHQHFLRAHSLLPNTTYHLRAVVIDRHGETSSSPDIVIETGEADTH